MRKSVVGIGISIIVFGFLIAIFYTFYIWRPFFWVWLYYSFGWIFLAIGIGVSLFGVWLKAPREKVFVPVTTGSNGTLNICPSCGSPIDPKAEFCGECGTKLS